MILPHPRDAKHKAWLYRLLTQISDNQLLANSLYFKGGTCAAMRGLLDRFSIDLDFDFMVSNEEIDIVRENLEKVFSDLELVIKDKSKEVPQYFLEYPAKPGERNTIKIDVTLPPPKANKYEPVELSDIDRIVVCQTKETMFANKLVAAVDRFEKNESIAGRDIYDIHYFFLQSYSYDQEVVLERRKISEIKIFFKDLIKFVEKEITQIIIDQDINSLLPYDKFKKIRKLIKSETLMFLQDELKRLERDI